MNYTINCVITGVVIVIKERYGVPGGPHLAVKEGFLEEVAFELRSKLFTLKDRQALIRPVLLQFERMPSSPGGPVKIEVVTTPRISDSAGPCEAVFLLSPNFAEEQLTHIINCIYVKCIT